MKLYHILSLLPGVLFTGCINGQPEISASNNFEYSFQSAHPNAQVLMKEDFYWDPTEETAPFGNDDGWDAAYGFKAWRISHKKESAVTYLEELIKRWNYPYFDYNEMDTSKIKTYLKASKQPTEAEIQYRIKTMKESNESHPAGSQEMDDAKLREIILSSSKDMNHLFLLGQDNAIIATGFAQFVLEGRVDADMRQLTVTAIKRQLLPLFINAYDEGYRDKRKQQLTRMLEVIQKSSN